MEAFPGGVRLAPKVAAREARMRRKGAKQAQTRSDGPWEQEEDRELWGKWSCSSLSVDGQESIETAKGRWLRKLDFDSEGVREIALDEDEKPLDKSERLPTPGCHVEITTVTLGASRIWWTVGSEAFGAAGQVERILHRAVGISQKTAPDFSSAA
jgi:hypothetical protein